MTLTSPFVIELTEAERRGPEQVADSRAAPFGQVRRASVILAVADGMPNAAAARAAGRHVDTVRAWRKRFAAERLVALTDRPRPLGRPRLAPGDKLRIIAAATQAPPGVDTAWTRRLLAGHLRISGLAVSASQVGRILNSAGLKPHLVRGWLTRPADPEFFTRAAAVCALYRRCPDNAVVFSVDEKTGITARSRKRPDQPGRPGQRTRREFGYVRHGTVSIIAALNVHTGQVLTQTIERNNAGTFTGFLRTLDTTGPGRNRHPPGHAQRLIPRREEDEGLADDPRPDPAQQAREGGVPAAGAPGRPQEHHVLAAEHCGHAGHHLPGTAG